MGAGTALGLLMGICLSAPATAFAGRPLTIDDADPVGRKDFELEAGLGYVHQPECKHWDFPLGLTYGLIPGLEVGFGTGGQFEEQTEIVEERQIAYSHHEKGIGDLVLGVKWQFVRRDDWIPRQALAPSVKFPTADDEHGLGSGVTDYDLTWIASKSLGKRSGAHLNLGYSFIGEPEGEGAGDVIHYGIAADYLHSDVLQWVGEIFAESELLSGTGPIVQCGAGLRRSISDSLIFDAAGWAGLSSGAPDFTVTAGLTWVFGFSQQRSP